MHLTKTPKVRKGTKFGRILIESQKFERSEPQTLRSGIIPVPMVQVEVRVEITSQATSHSGIMPRQRSGGEIIGFCTCK